MSEDKKNGSSTDAQGRVIRSIKDSVEPLTLIKPGAIPKPPKK